MALDAGYLSRTEFDELHALVTESGRLIAGLLRYLERSNFNGTKFK